MIPAPFRHVRVDTVEAAIAALIEHGDEAKLLAGGHSLLPIMKLRLATPGVLVDLGGVSSLSTIRMDGEELVIGAGTRHRDVHQSPIVTSAAPLLAYASSLVGDPQVRNRGTIGGSIVHADPAADLPCAMLALDARLVLQSSTGLRSIGVDDFFLGFWTTAMDVNEVMVEIRIPRQETGWSYQKFTTRSQDWATVAVAVAGGRISLASMAETPVRAGAAEAELAQGKGPVAAGALADAGTRPPEDLRASSDYRRNLAQVLTERALVEAATRR